MRPPGGGSNISLGADEEKPPVRKNKMASSVFAEPEDPYANRRNNPPGNICITSAHMLLLSKKPTAQFAIAIAILFRKFLLGVRKPVITTSKFTDIWFFQSLFPVMIFHTAGYILDQKCLSRNQQVCRNLEYLFSFDCFNSLLKRTGFII